MRIRPLLTLLAVGSGCGRAGDAPPGPAAEPAAAGDPTPGCPGEDFGSFLAAFTEDPALQERWTRFPLARTSLEEGGDEPRPVVDSLTRAEASEPLMPSSGALAAEGRVMRVEPERGGQMRVAVEKPDTDWLVHYLFEPHEGCWRLARIDDHSL